MRPYSGVALPPSRCDASAHVEVDPIADRAAAVDELVRNAMVSDETWAVLASELDAQQLMDLVFTVGAYDVLAMALRSFGVALDDDLVRKQASP